MYSFQKLEFDKILKIITEYTFSNYGKQEILNLKPFPEPGLELSKVSQLMELFLQVGEPPVGGISDIRNDWQKAKEGRILEPAELKKIAINFDAVRRLKDFFLERKDSYVFLTDFLPRLHTLDDFVKFAFRAIEDDDTISSKASEKLGRIRNDLKKAYQEAKSKLDKLIGGPLKDVLQDTTILTRDGRFVVPVKSSNRNRISGIIHSSSGSGATYYMEPESLIAFNDDIRNLLSQEQEEINRILRYLCQMLIMQEDKIEVTLLALIEWDSLWARAKFALANQATIPEITEDFSFQLIEAKHPLIGKHCVPLNLSLSDTRRGIVITGPNTGGKTVALKTVGLTHLMALSGIPVCVGQGSKVGFFEHILVDIGDEQSIEQSLSTFSSHMKNIISISELINPRSLILLDELGAGTDPVEGSAIALGILDTFLDAGAKIIVSTHMTPLKIYAYGKKELENASVIFNIEDLKPTFQLVVGLAGSSNAIVISERLGLQKTIVDRARSFMDIDVQKIDDVLNTLHQKKIEMEKDTLEIKSIKRQLEIQQSQLGKYLEEVKQKKYGPFMQQIQGMEEDLKELQRYLQTKIAEFRKDNSKTPQDFEETNKELQMDVTENLQKLKEKWGNAFRDEKKETELQSIQTGDFILLKDSKLVLKVTEVKQKTVVVEKDSKKVEIPKEFIEKKVASPDSTKNPEKIQESGYQEDYIGDTVDIRGKTVEEGMMIADGLIDFLLMKNRKEGFIIHGKGTGKLRDGLWQKFAKDKRIQAFRIGKPGEGGAGVTVLTIS